MSDQNVSQSDAAGRQEMMSELFAHMVIQQSNLALMMMGKVPNPENGDRVQNLDAAKLFERERTRADTCRVDADDHERDARHVRHAATDLRLLRPGRPLPVVCRVAQDASGSAGGRQLRHQCLSRDHGRTE